MSPQWKASREESEHSCLRKVQEHESSWLLQQTVEDVTEYNIEYTPYLSWFGHLEIDQMIFCKNRCTVYNAD